MLFNIFIMFSCIKNIFIKIIWLCQISQNFDISSKTDFGAPFEKNLKHMKTYNFMIYIMFLDYLEGFYHIYFIKKLFH